MAEIRFSKVEQAETKIRNVPIAVTPEGFWCCPSPAVFQKTLKPQTPLNKSKPPVSSPPNASSHRNQTLSNDKNPTRYPPNPETSDHHNHTSTEALNSDAIERVPRLKGDIVPRKVQIEFGEHGTSDMKLVLSGKHGLSVKLNVHKNVIVESSTKLAEKVAENGSGVSCLRIECEDVESYVETVGLMYCKDMKQRLMKQSVQRVLRILKVAETIGFSSCIKSCLDYLEAVPWVGEEEEEKVVSSVLQLQGEGLAINPVLKRVSSNSSKPPIDTLSHILELVLKSTDDRARREMKSIVLKLLRDNASTSNEPRYETIYNSCKTGMDSLLSLFRTVSERGYDLNEPISKQIALEADNLTWLLDILAVNQTADEFVLMWACQNDLVCLHPTLPIMTRYHVSFITSRVFVGIGRGEMLPSKDTRLMLLKTWLEPLINDYAWLQHGCRSFDRKVVEEGIGRTILTLPLEDQQSVMMSWLSTFLKAGDNCPNLQKAFEVWWRRTFVKGYAEPQINKHESCDSTASEELVGLDKKLELNS